MSRPARLWSRFWFAEVDARPYGLLRIGVALAGLQLWAGTLPLVRHFYSDAGEWPIAAARTWSSEYVARFLMWDGLGSFPVVAVLFALWGLALAALLVGWRTRAAAWAGWLLTVWFFFRNPTFNNGGDEVLRIVTLYLALGFSALRPEERAYSVDRARRVPRGAAPPTMPAWPLRFVQIQICVVYFVTGFWKVVGSAWWDGSALHYALANDTFSRFGAPDWPWARPLYALATISIAWWELLFPVLVSLRRTRIPVLAGGVLLHGAILALMNIGVFSFVMLGCYPAFLRGREAAWLAGLAGRAWPTRTGPGPQPSAASSASTAPALSSNSSR